MTITGSWDTRISRRTLLRTGGSAAAGIALARPHAAAGQGGAAVRRLPVHAGRRFGRPDAERDRALDAARARAARGVGCPGPQLPDWIFGVRYEVAADEGFRRIVRRGTVEPRCRTRRTPSHAEIARPAAGDAVLVPVQVGPGGEPGRPDPDRARRRLHAARRCASRTRRARTTRTGYYTRLRGHGAAGPRPRRAPRRLHLRGCRDRPASERARTTRREAELLHARRLPHPPRAVPDRPEPAGRARARSRG